MEIEKIRIMRGPNYWSIRQHQLIVATVGSFNETDKGLISALSDLNLLPDLPEPQPLLAQLASYVAITLQRLAGMECSYFTVSSDDHMVFPYTVEAAGIYAAQASAAIITRGITQVEEYLKHLRLLHRRHGLGPSTNAIAKAAIKRGVPVFRLDNDSLLLLGQGCRQQRVRAAVASSTSSIAVELVQDKEATKRFLADHYVPVPIGVIISRQGSCWMLPMRSDSQLLSSHLTAIMVGVLQLMYNHKPKP